jgi:hypothetical protein
VVLVTGIQVLYSGVCEGEGEGRSTVGCPPDAVLFYDTPRLAELMSQTLFARLAQFYLTAPF